MHVAETDVLVAGVDLQRRRLLFRRTDDDAVAHREDRLLPGIAGVDAFADERAGAGANIFALVAIAAGALANAEATSLAEIVPPRIHAAWRIGFVAGRPMLLRMQESGRIKRKEDLRIGVGIDPANLFPRAAARKQVTNRAVGEIARSHERSFGR